MAYESLAIYSLHQLSTSRSFYLKGRNLLVALVMIHGCTACSTLARSALAQYPAWGKLPSNFNGEPLELRIVDRMA